MNGLEARQKASEYSKKQVEVLKSKNLEAIADLLSDVQSLQEFTSTLQQEWLDKYFEDESDENFNESWRFDKANNALMKIENRLEKKYWELEEIQRGRIERKKEEKISKGWIKE